MGEGLPGSASQVDQPWARIGAGHGGLSRRKVRAVLEAALAHWAGTLHVQEASAPEG